MAKEQGLKVDGEGTRGEIVMADKTMLEKTIEYAIRGGPQIKVEEKRKWLGEFRERVILGLTMEQSHMKEVLDYVEEALKDNMSELIIINQNMSLEMMSEYMRLAKSTNKRFKSVATNHKEAMGVVIVSSKAVERENIEMEIQ